MAIIEGIQLEPGPPMVAGGNVLVVGSNPTGPIGNFIWLNDKKLTMSRGSSTGRASRCYRESWRFESSLRRWDRKCLQGADTLGTCTTIPSGESKSLNKNAGEITSYEARLTIPHKPQAERKDRREDMTMGVGAGTKSMAW